ncbi:hypothetical protein LSH36_155g03005 [Paralvinella palmiformis]|uniref:Mitochondrial fission process protein 1 n=1 Tax=Paralvinella palmiformis TaxID=53620 RepID=A0AAD9N9Q4_9ANNE|nr:hypothetical protein LSH36_155g03005 [Paralvinella palmiformis]
MGRSHNMSSEADDSKKKVANDIDVENNEILEKKVDIFRDTPLRYLGYANEVGESFRAQVHVNVVRFSYVLASGYVCADAYSKGKDAAEVKWSSDSVRQTKIFSAVFDTLIWQGLASVAIPGYTINRICFLSNRILSKTSAMPLMTRKWTVTLIGLGSIPFIIKPIDHFVDWLLESTLRKWFSIGPVLESDIVHHRRNG